MQEIECPICKAAPLECYTVCVPCFDSLRDSHLELLEACRALITANQHVRDLSLNRDEAHRGMIWGEARSMLDVAKLKAQAVITKATE